MRILCLYGWPQYQQILDITQGLYEIEFPTLERVGGRIDDEGLDDLPVVNVEFSSSSSSDCFNIF